MSVSGNLLEKACSPLEHDGRSSASKVLAVSLTATNYLAQIAAGAAIDSAGPFTAFSPTRVPQIVLGAGGGAVTYTITGTNITDGAVQTEDLVFTGPATIKATLPYATITRLQSNVNPAGTTDLQAADTMVWPPSRAILVTVAGNIVSQLADDSTTATITGVPAGQVNWRYRRINITSTTATGIFLLW